MNYFISDWQYNPDNVQIDCSAGCFVRCQNFVRPSYSPLYSKLSIFSFENIFDYQIDDSIQEQEKQAIRFLLKSYHNRLQNCLPSFPAVYLQTMTLQKKDKP